MFKKCCSSSFDVRFNGVHPSLVKSASANLDSQNCLGYLEATGLPNYGNDLLAKNGFKKFLFGHTADRPMVLNEFSCLVSIFIKPK